MGIVERRPFKKEGFGNRNRALFDVRVDIIRPRIVEPRLTPASIQGLGNRVLESFWFLFNFRWC